jgi:hypothetical protein
MKSLESALALALILNWLSCAFAAPSDVWDKAAAAKYLDARMDLWFQKAKKLKTNEGSTSCVSCHTAVPYSMARPALRKDMGCEHPMPQETRLLEETIRRVESYDTHELLYKGKVEQSRGTEAVLNLLIVAGEDARQNCQTPSEHTRKALRELWKEQRPDGAWDWLDFALEPYESVAATYYGATLAALAVGTVPGYSGGGDENLTGGIVKLRDYLKTSYSAQNLHNRAWVLLASARMKDLLTTEQKAALRTELQGKQNTDGGWSLQKLGAWTWSKNSPPFCPEGKLDAALLAESDGYATGLIGYALSQTGCPKEDPILTKARNWLVSNQREYQIDEHRWKCWRTYSLNYDHEHGGENGEPWRRMFMSDGATAFGVLALLALD